MMNLKTQDTFIKTFTVLLVFMVSISFSFGQKIELKDMSFWQNTYKSNWQITGFSKANPFEKYNLTTETGTGILANLPTKEVKSNLISNISHGDADISFEFMMAAGSNSGFYLQGRYEIQLLDSWGVLRPATGDCGGIYKRRRWNISAKGDTTEYLWEGHAPRTNACLAPGIWQKMEISFQAPKFDTNGNKVSNAKVIWCKLNGQIIHENVEMTGPTGGPIAENETTMGPIMIQGDHGPVAFKNLNIINLNGKAARIGPVQYTVYEGVFKENTDWAKLKPTKTGTIDKLTWEVSGQPNEFATIHNTTLNCPTAGKYTFTIQAGGKNSVKINGQEIIKEAWNSGKELRNGSIELPEGTANIEITNYKTDGWIPAILAAWVTAPNSRKVAIHGIGSTLAGSPADPIMVEAQTNTVLRSFIDIFKAGKKLKRVTHGVNVGSPNKIHYSYDLENANIVQFWKGEFLDASPMWDNRGDGSTKPRGVNQYVYNDHPIQKLGKADSLFKYQGYELNADDSPVFLYKTFGMNIKDGLKVVDNKMLQRTIKIENADTSLNYTIHQGNIEKHANNLYLLDKQYFVQVNGANIITENGIARLVLPLANVLEYNILW